jgi:hypothetical protein
MSRRKVPYGLTLDQKLCAGEGVSGQFRAHVYEQADRVVADQEVVTG